MTYWFVHDNNCSYIDPTATKLKTKTMTIDQDIQASWARGKDLFEHRHDPDFVYQEDDQPEQIANFVDSSLVSDTGSKLHQLIACQQNVQELEEELKQVKMEWFWNGFYKGHTSK